MTKESSSVYVTLGFAGIALVAAMVVGVVVLKRRNGRHPHHQVRPFSGHTAAFASGLFSLHSAETVSHSIHSDPCVHLGLIDAVSPYSTLLALYLLFPYWPSATAIVTVG